VKYSCRSNNFVYNLHSNKLRVRCYPNTDTATATYSSPA